MAFGYENWKATTLAGVEATCAVNCAGDKIIAAADTGEAPIRVISADLAHHLGTQGANSYVGRLIRERLGPNFKVAGRKKWPRENGVESGAVYKRVK